MSLLTPSSLRSFGTFFVRKLDLLSISGNDLRPRRPALAGWAGRFPGFSIFSAFCRFSGIGGFSGTAGISGSGRFSAGGSCWLFAAWSSSSFSSCRSCSRRSLALFGSPCCCWLRSTWSGCSINLRCRSLTRRAYEQKGCRTKTEFYVTVLNNI